MDFHHSFLWKYHPPKDAITINEFKEKFEKNDLSNIITIEQIFKEKEAINLPQKYLKQYINGVNLDITKINEKRDYKNDVYKIYVENLRVEELNFRTFNAKSISLKETFVG